MEQQSEIETAGKWLSTVVPCGKVRLPYDKPVFECGCGIPFPKYIVLRYNIKDVLEIHKGE